MSGRYVTIDKIVNDYVLSIDDDDYGSNVSDVMLRQYALRGAREVGFDMDQRIKSVKLTVNENMGTAELPCDFVELTKIGTLGPDGLVYVWAINKNMNILPDQPNTPIPDYLQGLDSYVFRNYLYENALGRLYGLGGGQGANQYRMNYEENRIEISTNAGVSEVVIEYIADEAKSTNPCVPIVAEEAVRAYMYFHIVQRKSSVPANEKARARSEYYNERRLANARLKSFGKQDALQTIRQNFKLSPKA